MDEQERELRTYRWVVQLATLEARRAIVRNGAAIALDVGYATNGAIYKVRQPHNFQPTEITPMMVCKASLEACIIANTEAAKGIYNVQRS